jgi:hypothetical protein
LSSLIAVHVGGGRHIGLEAMWNGRRDEDEGLKCTIVCRDIKEERRLERFDFNANELKPEVRWPLLTSAVIRWDAILLGITFCGIKASKVERWKLDGTVGALPPSSWTTTNTLHAMVLSFILIQNRQYVG